MRHPLFFLIFAALPASALADCPTAADLANGVRFELATGGTWDLRASTGADREVTLVWDPAYPAQSLTYVQGIYLAGFSIPDQDFVISVEFMPSLRTAPAPAAGATWETMTTTFTNGVPRQDTVSLMWGAPEDVSFGACTYQSLPMHWSTVSPDGIEDAHVYAYLPEFGAVVLNGQGFGTTWDVTGVTAL